MTWVFLAVSGSATLKFADGRGSSCSFWFSPLTIGLKWRPSLHFGVINPFRENCGVFSVIAVGKYKVFSSDWFSAYCPGVVFVICIRLFSLILLPLVLAGSSFVQTGFAQAFGGRNVYRPVQLPVVSFFNVRTAVSVPDGGTMSLGGVSRYSESSIRRGIPGLGSPVFQNRATGYSAQSSRASVRTTLLSTREINEALEREGARRALISQRKDPNGSFEVQRKADFITRNIGRVRK